jgi:hypothetical protein
VKTFKDLKIGDEIYCINQYIKIGVCGFTIKDINQSNTNIEYFLSNNSFVKMTENDINKDNFNDMFFINEGDALHTKKMYENILNWFKLNIN